MLFLDAYNGKTGQFLKRLEFSSASWSDSINSDGSLSATVVETSNEAAILKPYHTILAISIDNERILHAGYIKQVAYDRGACTFDVNCGGGLAILEKRLVLNSALDNWDFWNRQVTIDNDNPPGEWVLHLGGAYSDIIRGLILETTGAWGALPIEAAAWRGEPNHERNYQCWELKTIASAIKDIGDLEDGIEYRFDPITTPTGELVFKQMSAYESGDYPRELVDNVWSFVADAQGANVSLGSEDDDGSELVSECFCTGGKDSDKLLTARARSDNLASQNYPNLQAADNTHSSISEINTLQGYANASVQLGDRSQKTTSMDVPLELDVKVGDWADVGFKKHVYHYKITDVKGSSDKSMLELGMRERY